MNVSILLYQFFHPRSQNQAEVRIASGFSRNEREKVCLGNQSDVREPGFQTMEIGKDNISRRSLNR
jgi:hypothetical protein